MPSLAWALLRDDLATAHNWNPWPEKTGKMPVVLPTFRHLLNEAFFFVVALDGNLAHVLQTPDDVDDLLLYLLDV